MKQRDFDCFREPADHICSQYRRKKSSILEKNPENFQKFSKHFFNDFKKLFFGGPKKTTAQKSKAFDMT